MLFNIFLVYLFFMCIIEPRFILRGLTLFIKKKEKEQHPLELLLLNAKVFCRTAFAL